MNTYYLYLDSTHRNRSDAFSSTSCDFTVYHQKTTDSKDRFIDPIAVGQRISTLAGGLTGTTVASTATTITLAVGESAQDNFFVGDFIRIFSGTGVGQVREITNYVGATKVSTIANAWTTNPDATSVYNIHLKGKPVQSTSAILTTQAGSIATTIVLSATDSSVNDFYNGFYVTQLSGGGDGEIRRIVDYVGATRTATLATGWTTIPVLGVSYDIYDVKENFEHLRDAVKEDRSHEFYEIKLLSLSIPNLRLDNHEGKFLTQFSHVFVNLENIDGNLTKTQYRVSTNTQDSKVCTFVVPIIDNNSPFLQLKCKMKVQLQFSLNTSMRFRVLLPDGQPILFETADNASPNVPNDLLQVKSVFKFKKIL